jgi:regulator of protease activity HflC (stomatin/prohibitin superfamily)
MVHYSIDQAITSADGIIGKVQLTLQKKLDMMDCGIMIERMEVLGRITWPTQVNTAFEESNRAEQTRQSVITNARADAEKTLNEVGGVRAMEILNTLQQGDLSIDERVALLLQLSGESREKIANAQAKRTRTVQQAKAIADNVRQLENAFRQRPTLVIKDRYRETIERIMEVVDEKIILESSIGRKDEVRINITRDVSKVQEEIDKEANKEGNL